MGIEVSDPSILMAPFAGILADPSRASMLTAMLDGRAYTATELARAANISAPTASFHLGKMADAHLVQCTSQGRHRYFRLWSPDVAQTLETLLALQTGRVANAIKTNCPADLRAARRCYDHMAGKFGVEIYCSMIRKNWLVFDGQYLHCTALAMTEMADWELDPAQVQLGGKPCLDWSERRFHLGGSLGRVVLSALLSKRWLLQGDGRSLTISYEGRSKLLSLGLLCND